MDIKLLASGSSGNSSLIYSGNEVIAVDCGVPIRAFMDTLDKVGVGISRMSALLISHMHGDHFNPSLAARISDAGVPIYSGAADIQNIKEALSGRRSVSSPDIRTIPPGIFSAGSMEVRGFSVYHESQENLPGGCYGFCIYRRSVKEMEKISIVTDIGRPGREVAGFLSGSDIIVIESNHDEGMLRSSERPTWLKRRIMSSHLSNRECLGILNRVCRAAPEKKSHIVLAHISQECNSVEKITEEFAGLIESGNVESVSIACESGGGLKKIVI